VVRGWHLEVHRRDVTCCTSPAPRPGDRQVSFRPPVKRSGRPGRL